MGVVAEGVWKRLDRPGHDVVRLERTADGWQIAGVAIGVAEDGPYALEYEVQCDAGWRSRSATVAGWSGGERREHAIDRGDDGTWFLDGAPAPQAHGCVDVDLSFTPATNTIAVRRLAPALHEVVRCSAAWLTVPGFRLERLDQRYERIAASTYRYQAPELDFEAEIDFWDSGLVRTYSGLWVSESTPPAARGRPPRA